MIQFKDEFGARVLHRLQHEIVAWLITVSRDGTPQPNPVWFLWDGDTILVYTTPGSAKVKNILSRPNVSLHFEGADTIGGDVVVLNGSARVELHSAYPPQDYQANTGRASRSSGIHGISSTRSILQRFLSNR